MNGNLLTSLSFLNSSDNDHGFDWLIETTVTENKEVLCPFLEDYTAPLALNLAM